MSRGLQREARRFPEPAGIGKSAVKLWQAIVTTWEAVMAIDLGSARIASAVQFVDFDQGHWCCDCDLPSGVRMITAVTALVDGAQRIHLEQRLGCHLCSGTNISVTFD